MIDFDPGQPRAASSTRAHPSPSPATSPRCHRSRPSSARCSGTTGARSSTEAGSTDRQGARHRLRPRTDRTSRRPHPRRGRRSTRAGVPGQARSDHQLRPGQRLPWPSTPASRTRPCRCSRSPTSWPGATASTTWSPTRASRPSSPSAATPKPPCGCGTSPAGPDLRGAAPLGARRRGPRRQVGRGDPRGACRGHPGRGGTRTDPTTAPWSPRTTTRESRTPTSPSASPSGSATTAGGAPPLRVTTTRWTGPRRRGPPDDLASAEEPVAQCSRGRVDPGPTDQGQRRVGPGSGRRFDSSCGRINRCRRQRRPGEVTLDHGTFQANVQPDVFDAQDLDYRPRLQVIPHERDWRAEDRYVMEQVGYSCTGHAVAAMVNAILAQQ